ncbi:MAG: tetratricopeptide repeat protein [Lachnospiraceae bacterium]|nr:tetratricopeptide repeat protein [Lachnospiraceae bacterium]
MKNKKSKVFKRVTAGMMAGMLLIGNMGTVYAAESDEVRNKAKAAYEEKNYQEAKNYYEELIASNEATAADYWYSGASDTNLGFYYLAKEKIETAQELMENGDTAVSVAEQRMKSMYYAGDYWYVEKIYEDAVRKGIVNTYLKSMYADSLANCKQYSKAIGLYEELLNEYEGDEISYKTTYLNAIGNMHKNMGEYEIAKQYYNDALALDGNQAAYSEKMSYMELEGKLEDVEQIVTSYMSERSNEEIADVLAEKGYYQEALDYYEKATQENGADVRTSIADAYYDFGMAKEAAAIYEELLVENPTNTAYMNSLGSIYCDGLGRYAEAEELFKKVMELNPDANGTLSNFGVITRKEGDLNQTVEAYQNALEQFPGYTKIYNYRIMYQKDITIEEAKEIFSQYPGWPEDETMQAMMLMDTIGDSASDITLESYLDYYRQLLAEDGGNYYFLKTVADLLKSQGNYEEALEYYLQAKEVAGILSYYAVNGLGDCYFYCGQYENAAACYEQNAIDFHATNLLRSMADCYLMSGDVEQAKAALERYKAEGGTGSIASYNMLIAYQENDYEALLENATKTLEEAPGNVKAKAYKAVALNALKMEGADEVIADIDSIIYAAGNQDKMIAESILGRLDQARRIYGEMQQLYPVEARQAVFDYEIRNLLQDPEFCEMAGLEVPESSVETMLSGIPQGEGNATSPIIPVATGAGVLAVLGGVVVLLKKKSK